jgi:hypothetical protein
MLVVEAVEPADGRIKADRAARGRSRGGSDVDRKLEKILRADTSRP